MKKIFSLFPIFASISFLIGCQSNQLPSQISDSSVENNFHSQQIRDLVNKGASEVKTIFNGDTVNGLELNGKIYIEGDIEIPSNFLAKTAAATPAEAIQWPHGVICYSINSNVPSDKVTLIKQAFSAWENGTSYRFYQRTNEPNYLSISIDPSLIGGVTSFIGYGSNGANAIRLTPTFNLSIIEHELGHVIGFMHEESRSDRDQYVIYYPNNDLCPDQVTKKNGTNFGTFDFSSVMVYGSYMCGRPGSPAFTKLDGSIYYGGTVVSAGDISAANQMVNLNWSIYSSSPTTFTPFACAVYMTGNGYGGWWTLGTPGDLASGYTVYRNLYGSTFEEKSGIKGRRIEMGKAFDDVWVVDNLNRLFHYISTSGSFIQIPLTNGVLDVGANGNGIVWIITDIASAVSGYAIAKGVPSSAPGGYSWTIYKKVAGASLNIGIAVDEIGNAYMIGPGKSAYYFDGSTMINTNLSNVADISVGPNGAIWALDANKHAFLYDKALQRWIDRGGNNFTFIDVDYYGRPFAQDPFVSGKIYR